VTEGARAERLADARAERQGGRATGTPGRHNRTASGNTGWHLREAVLSNMGTYDERRENFTWDAAKEVLDWEQGELLNIGAICSDRVCARGHADRVALIWEGFGDRKATYTFGDLKVLSNGFAQMLVDQGIAPGDRVCLFMDKIPSLYFAFLGVLKMGGVVQPLSAPSAMSRSR
jgi:hypothetical protein